MSKEYNSSTQCNHTKPKMGYIKWFRYAGLLHEKGEKQTKCEHCKRFVWDSEWTQPNNQ